MFLFIIQAFSCVDLHSNLNTSYVLIYRRLLSQKGITKSDLNTSYVLIYQAFHSRFYLCKAI